MSEQFGSLKMAQLQVTFRPYTKLVEANIKALAANILVSSELHQAALEGHRQIEKVVKARLLADDSSTRDPQASKKSNFKRAEAVANNITSLVLQSPNKIIGGTGKVSHMDDLDPLNSIRPISNDKIRLWRILEWGVDPFNTLKARNPLKPMVFWWRRKSIFFVGKSKDYFFSRAQTGPYANQPMMIGVAPYDEAIEHPGQLGRFYWQKSRSDARKVYSTIVRLTLQRIIKKYSSK